MKENGRRIRKLELFKSRGNRNMEHFYYSRHYLKGTFELTEYIEISMMHLLEESNSSFA